MTPTTRTALLAGIALTLGAAPAARAADTNVAAFANGRNAPHYTTYAPGGHPAVRVDVATGTVFGFNNGERWAGAPGARGGGAGANVAPGLKATKAAKAPKPPKPMVWAAARSLLAGEPVAPGVYRFEIPEPDLGQAPARPTLELSRSKAGGLSWRVPGVDPRWRRAAPVEIPGRRRGEPSGFGLHADVVQGGVRHLIGLTLAGMDHRTGVRADVLGLSVWTRRDGEAPRNWATRAGGTVGLRR